MELDGFVMSRSATAEPFFCIRCSADKKAKNKATRKTADGTETICNGCYGFLKSVAK